MSGVVAARRILPGRLAASHADLLRALVALRPREEATLSAILAALGHALEEAQARAAPSRPSAPARPPAPRPAAREAEPAAEAAPRRPLPSDLVVLDEGSGSAPPWMTDAALLPLSADPGAVFRAPMPPLLDPRRQRAILAQAAARRLPDGELDMPEVVRAVAGLRPLRRLPRRPVASLRGGALLLCDAGPGMEPFALDVAMLAAAIVAAVGRDRIRVARFHGCPSAGLLRWEDHGLDPWQPPQAGMPVLAVTDLGATRVPGQPATPAQDWRAFETALRRRGSPLTILFPGSMDRVPAALRGRLRVLPLDRATGVRSPAGAAR